MTLPILVDLSEVQSKVPEMLSNLGVEIKIGRLKVCDYVIPVKNSLYESLAFERKGCGDFIASKLDGRLKRQLLDMSTHFYRSYIILEGNPTATLMVNGFDRQIFYATVMSAVLRRSTEGAKGVVSMIPTDTPHDTALILEYAYRKIQEDDIDLNPAPEAHASTRREISILAMFPNIGLTKSKALLEAKGNLYNVFMSNVNELDSVKGIGPGIAQTIYDTLHKTYEVTQNV